jgi:hypothetical protein
MTICHLCWVEVPIPAQEHIPIAHLVVTYVLANTATEIVGMLVIIVVIIHLAHFGINKNK